MVGDKPNELLNSNIQKINHYPSHGVRGRSF